MRKLRCALLLFVSSMAVKTLLMALFTLWGLIAKREFPISMDDFIEGALFFELVFAIPLYLIYLPIYLHRTQHGNYKKGFLRLTALFLGFALLLVFDLKGSPEMPGTPIFMAIAWTAYLLATFELHMYLSKKEDNLTAEDRIKRKNSYVFFWTGIPAALIAGTVTGFAAYIFITIQSCIAVPECSISVLPSWAWKAIHTMIMISSLLVLGLFAGIVFYICFLYPMYGFFIKRLWWQNKRSYAHFALAATTSIFWMGLAYFLFTLNFDDPEEWQIFFYCYSFIALLTSALHLKFLKKYDSKYGIPEEPPGPNLWYNNFLSRLKVI